MGIPLEVPHGWRSKQNPALYLAAALTLLSGGIAAGKLVQQVINMPDRLMVKNPVLLLRYFERFLAAEDITELKEVGRVPPKGAMAKYAHDYFVKIIDADKKNNTRGINPLEYAGIVAGFQKVFLSTLAREFELRRILRLDDENKPSDFRTDKKLSEEYQARVRFRDGIYVLLLRFEDEYRVYLANQDYRVEHIGKEDRARIMALGIENVDKDVLVVYKKKPGLLTLQSYEKSVGYVEIAENRMQKGSQRLSIDGVFATADDARAALLFGAVDYARDKTADILSISNNAFDPLMWVVVNSIAKTDTDCIINMGLFKPMDNQVRLLPKPK